MQTKDAGRVSFVARKSAVLLAEQDELIAELFQATQRNDHAEKDRIKKELEQNRQELHDILRPFKGVVIEINESFEYYD